MERHESKWRGTRWKRCMLMLGAAMVLAACSGGNGGGSAIGGGGTPSPGGGSEATTIEGVASAPASGVALFEPSSPFQLALEFFVSPAAAAITGLEPVGGATVELVRIDDNGDQVGDVLATTTTSTTGNYTLNVPAGVNLAGNLIVRIQGLGGVQMRAQAVTQEVDISPVSEFVLQKFIDNGADLENLTTSTVVELKGQVEEFDITAGADLTQMLATLEAETGDFVDAQIYAAQSAPGNAANVAGGYHATEIGFRLHDADNGTGGDVEIEINRMHGMTLSDGGSGSVDVALGGEDSAGALLSHFGAYSLRYEAGVEVFEETFTAPLSEQGVLTIESPFEEDIDGDYGWRQPPSVLRLQKAASANVLAGIAEHVEVRYRTTDTDEDGIPDAVDPDQRDGDEVSRSLLLLAQEITDASVSGLTGDYGRVGFRTAMSNAGFVELAIERNKLTFDGAGSFDAGAGTSHELSSSGYLSVDFLAESGMSFTMDVDGDLLTLNGDAVDGFVAADYGLVVLNGASATDDGNPDDELYLDAAFDTTLAVKLPISMLNLEGRTYRVVFLGMEMDGSAFAVSNTRFDSVFRVTGVTTGELDVTSSYLRKDDMSAQVAIEVDSDAALPVEIDLAADGAMTITLTDDWGTFLVEGYMNQDGSLGVFHTRYADTGGEPIEVGMLMLVETP